MNIFCFWTATGIAHYVAANSAEEGVNILQRLGINVKTTDYSGESAVVTDTGEGLQLLTRGYFGRFNELINDNGEIV